MKKIHCNLLLIEDLAELMRLEKQINNGDGKIENG